MHVHVDEARQHELISEVYDVRARWRLHEAVAHVHNLPILNDDGGVAARLLAWTINQLARVQHRYFFRRGRGLLRRDGQGCDQRECQDQAEGSHRLVERCVAANAAAKDNILIDPPLLEIDQLRDSRNSSAYSQWQRWARCNAHAGENHHTREDVQDLG
jgi:hypothetical protein